MSYFFHPNAENEHLNSVAYYESKQAGLGASYLTEFELIMKLICDVPDRNRVELEPSIRRKNMNRFPFTIYYQNISHTIQVLAVAHYRRSPAYWLNRK